MRRRSVSSLVSPGPAGADASPEPAQLDALAPQAGQAVAEQGEFDLQHALPAGGVLGEDVEDHGHPVHDVTLEQLLEVALLPRSEAIVEHDHVHIEPDGVPSQRLRLSRTPRRWQDGATGV